MKQTITKRSLSVMGKTPLPLFSSSNIDYLTTLEETQKVLLEKSPNKGGKGLLKISLRNLFSPVH